MYSRLLHGDLNITSVAGETRYILCIYASFFDIFNKIIIYICSENFLKKNENSFKNESD